MLFSAQAVGSGKILEVSKAHHSARVPICMSIHNHRLDSDFILQ